MKRYYRHYKGGIYEYVSEALHTETNEIMVIYKNGINTFCRPREIFQEVVRADNKQYVLRFRQIFFLEMLKIKLAGKMKEYFYV